MKTIVNLLGLDAFFGIIFPDTTGYVYTNQVGGTRCAHPHLEGIFAPLSSRLNASFAFSLLDVAREYDGDLVTRFLREEELDEAFDVVPPTLALELSSAWASAGNFCLAEAWVPVKVRSSHNERDGWWVLDPFAGKVGVLTWCNSD
jgi:hypothetical protein